MAYSIKKPEPEIDDMRSYISDLFEGNEEAQSRIPSNRLMELSRRLHCENATDYEFAQYMYYCVKYNLDPLLGYVEFVKYDKTSNKPAQIFIGKRGMLTIAARNPNFVAANTDIYYKNPNVIVAMDTPAEAGQPATFSKINLGTDRKPEMYASCVVYRKDRDVPTYVTIRTKEYNTGNSTWASKSETMSKKVALTQALEMAFPESYANGFSPEEFGLSPNIMRKSPKYITENVKATYASLPRIALPNGIQKPARICTDDIEGESIASGSTKQASKNTIDEEPNVTVSEDVIESVNDIDEDSNGYDLDDGDLSNDNDADLSNDNDAEEIEDTPFVPDNRPKSYVVLENLVNQNTVPRVVKPAPPTTVEEDIEDSLF